MGIIEQLAEMRAKEAREKATLETSEKMEQLFVENLLANTEFSIDKIASLAGVATSFVEKVKEPFGPNS